MSTLLAPYALGGAVLLAIPILVHLFKPRKVRRTPFSSLRWLHLTQHRLSRRIKWHQIFLFLLRAAFLLLLVVALARPMYRRGEGGAFSERFIVVDVSRSMSYQPLDRPSPIEQAKRLAAELISHPLGDDRAAVLLTGSGTQVLAPLSRDADACLPALAGVRAGATDTDLSSALEVIRPMLSQRRPDARVELFFFTDNHQQSWNQGGIASFLKDLPFGVTVRLVDVGVASPQNGWIADCRLVQADNPPRLFIRVQAACVGDAVQDRVIRVAGLTDLPERTQDVTLEPERPAQVDFDLPADYDLSDKIAHVRLEPPDSLPGDDSFYLNLDSKAGLKVLIVESESARAETLHAGFHLRTAVQALASSTNNAIDLVSKTTATVSAADIAQADVIFLADVPDLADANLASLENRVQNGGGLAVFLGPDVKSSFYNTRLYQPLHPANGLLPAALKNVTEANPARGGTTPLADIRWQHPLLKGMFDPVLGDLAKTRLRSYYRFDPPAPAGAGKEGWATGVDVVLAWADESTPAIVERAVGAGKVILFNTTANDQWGDLARRQSFVPLIDRVLSYLSGGGVRRTFQVGEAVTLSIPGNATEEKIRIRTPGGALVKPVLGTGHGRTLLRVGAVAEPGIYRVERDDGNKGFAFTVQLGRGDSVLTPLDTATLARWWEPATFDVVQPDALGNTLVSPPDRLALWPWLVGLACLVLMAEMFFVHWLCPRVNPKVTDSVIHKRRILGSRSVASK